MKHTFIIILSIFLCLSNANAQMIRVKTGLEVLVDSNFALLNGKRVGLVTNPTGVDKNFKSTIDILNEAKNVNLVALYSPEHGLRGDVHAGDKIDSNTDTKTGLPVHSLYGATRKPTHEMLKGVDVIVFDIQDNGCRSFTYISTMGLVMQTAAECGVEVIVLDRPNPLGGRKIEGSIVEKEYTTFVSQYPIPYIYGLTCGELALMINEEKMLGETCDLTIVQMEGWMRDMTYKDTGLAWILPSPHTPQAETSCYYPATGMLGELSYLSTGIGYTLPFQMLGAAWIDAEKFATAMNNLNLPGWYFRPVTYNPFYGWGKGETLHGVQLYITDYDVVKLTEPQFYAIEVLAKLYPGHKLVDSHREDRCAMFDKVLGSNYIRETLFKNHTFSSIKDFWYKDIETFKSLSEQYYLYY